MDSRSHHNLTEGRLARSERAPAALDTDHFRLDERSLAELVNTATALSRLLTYFDADNRPHPPLGTAETQAGKIGAWESFFRNDVTFLLAEIAATDTRAEYRASRAAPVEQLERSIIAEARRLWRWQARAKDLALLTPAGSVAVDLAQTLAQPDKSELNTDVFRDLRARLEQADADPASDPGIARWRPPTGPHSRSPDWMYSALNRATAQVAAAANRYLERALTERQDHGAHLGLFLAFVKLLQRSQADLNRMTDRHLEFYFREVLRSAPQAAKPDHSHVTFALAQGAQPVDLPAGTALVAGSGAGPEAVIFETDRALRVTPSHVRALSAVAVHRNPTRRDRAGAPFVDGVQSFPAANTADGRGAPLSDPRRGWSPFGPDRGAPAEVGFALAAPILELAGGTRHIRATLDFEPRASFTLTKALADYRAVLADRYEGDLTDARFLRFLGDAVRVSLTTASGTLYRVRNVHLARDTADPDRLALTLVVPPSAPPIAAHVAEHPQPMLRVALNPHARAYAYSPFHQLRVIAAGLEVEVTDLRALALETDLAPVAPGKPFAPFGPLPLPRARLTLHAHELTRKTPARLEVTLRWSQLPLPPETFASHYAAYGDKIGTDSFRARLSRSDGTVWHPLPVRGPGDRHPGPDAALFTSGPDDMAVTEARWEVPHLPDPNASERPEATDVTHPGIAPKGALQIEFTAPHMGFGHRLYPELMAQAALARSEGIVAKILGALSAPPTAEGATSKTELPKPPLLPLITQISLSYSAACHASGLRPGDTIELWNLRVLGPMTPARERRLLRADLNVDGYLMVGLANTAPPETLSLFFEIHDSLAANWHPGDPGPRPGVIWYYLSAAGWRKLPAGVVRTETTHGLTTQGVVEIALPADALRTDHFSAEPLIWISAALHGDRRRFGRIVDITCQGVSVTRRVAPGPAPRPAPLPAGAIKRFLAARPGIAKVHHPVPSEGGRAREQEDAFRVRLSERLGHKSRALRPMDFARMVLQEFDTISDVRCRATGGRIAAQSRVELIVAPRRDPARTDRYPRVPLHVRDQIAAWLSERCAMPLGLIDVRNPAYEEIRVQAHLVPEATTTALSMTKITRHLSDRIAPWLFDPARPMPIGAARLDVASLANHLRSYAGLEDVLGFSVVHLFRTRNANHGAEGPYGFKDSARINRPSGEGAAGADDSAAIMIGATPASVFVPARVHPISILPPRSGIGDLSVGTDFIAADPRRLLSYRDDPAALPLLPVAAGIGTLAIGQDFVLTTPEDTLPPSFAPDIRQHGIDTVFLTD